MWKDVTEKASVLAYEEKVQQPLPDVIDLDSAAAEKKSKVKNLNEELVNIK